MSKCLISKSTKRTNEQLTATKELTSAAPGYRVVADAEGWPISLGKYGRLEHLGAGQLAAFTNRRLIKGRILAIPGVTPTRRAMRNSASCWPQRPPLPWPAYFDAVSGVERPPTRSRLPPDPG